ncbi:MAG: aminotransferase class I/II-fold pyridoxal phosphate-dependent enzyme [Calditrichaeota bacterium]|nr:MAG: aminotransferase class I/II-fold pyridoxal phosphate-dependent enzyme [Calditrichota bacterium]
MRTVDLRSDTLTCPTPEMREAMMTAEVGDDVFGEDPTINRLQERMAELTGKEAALFVTSGTQGNQVAINAHTRPGQEVIVEKDAHIFNYESGAPAMLAGVQLNGLIGSHGVLTAEQVEAAIRPSDDHYPQTGLICLENTHNRAGGTIYPLEEMKRIYQLSRRYKLPLHLDGARLWNASVATGIPLREYCRYADSVMLAFSKGLGAPVGSIVVGDREFIQRAHFYRKAYGGGIRQGGILAAAALYALDHHLPLLAEDHRRTRQLAEEIAELPGISVDLSTVQTNILIFEVDPARMTAEELVARLGEQGVKMFPFGPTRVRAVTHLHITDEDIEYTVGVFKKLLA